MLPDSNGNSVLHAISFGAIKDVEYDFVKTIISKYDMRLTRNKDSKSPLDIIRSYSSKSVVLRGQPNYKKKLWEYFEERMK